MATIGNRLEIRQAGNILICPRNLFSKKSLLMITDNKTVYSTVEFDNWAKREGLTRSESFLIQNFFDSSPTHETVEAGTAGGWILLELQRCGFSNLSGFDYVAGFIEQAKKSDSNGKIHFQVMDATRLIYPDGKFS